ncbi:hypothetical protein GCM10007921_42800 [Tritonibacter mobilis]|nr:hypothetical protein GCM10007921_42800 [Tritonibacter mobilis]
MVVVERRGRERWNHFDALPIHDLQTRWIGPYAEYAASVLSDLKAGVESDDAELNELSMQAQDQIK